jgi:hypothetical protein
MKKIIQPFSYQQSDGSCWITSVHNGLLHLLGSSKKIEHFVSRMFYVITSSEGTDTDEARLLVRLINENKRLPVLARIIKKESITEAKLRRSLRQHNRVLICDTLSGIHSILLIDIEGNEIIAFDPDWNHVKDRKTVRGCYQCCPYERHAGKVIFNPYYNARIDINHFLKTRTIETVDQRFIMGASSARFVIELIRE